MYAIFNIDLCAIIVICIWIWLTPLRLFLTIHRIYSHNTKQEATRPARHRHKAVQFLHKRPCHHHQNHPHSCAKRFADFYQIINASPIPGTVHTLLLFAIHLTTSNIAHTTNKVYISIIQHMHVSAGLQAQFNSQLTPRLQLILKGIKRNQAISHPQESSTNYPTNYAIHQWPAHQPTPFIHQHPNMGSLLSGFLWLPPCQWIHHPQQFIILYPPTIKHFLVLYQCLYW